MIAYKQEPQYLKTRILEVLEREKAKVSRRKFAFFGVLSLVSASSLVLAFQNASSSFASSGLYSYLALLSDGTKLFAYWKEFLISIAESLPVLSISLVLCLAALLVWSISSGIKNIRYA